MLLICGRVNMENLTVDQVDKIIIGLISIGSLAVGTLFGFGIDLLKGLIKRKKLRTKKLANNKAMITGLAEVYTEYLKNLISEELESLYMWKMYDLTCSYAKQQAFDRYKEHENRRLEFLLRFTDTKKQILECLYNINGLVTKDLTETIKDFAVMDDKININEVTVKLNELDNIQDNQVEITKLYIEGKRKLDGFRSLIRSKSSETIEKVFSI